MDLLDGRGVIVVPVGSGGDVNSVDQCKGRSKPRLGMGRARSEKLSAATSGKVRQRVRARSGWVVRAQARRLVRRTAPNDVINLTRSHPQDWSS